MRKLLFVSLVLFIFGCATEPKPRAASEFLFSTDKSTTNLFGDVKSGLAQHKYKSERQDDAAGILLMSPKTFSFDANGGNKMLGRQSIQIRQEGASLKVRMTYECNYSGDRATFVPCLETDDYVASKVDRMENAFVDFIKPILRSPERKTASKLIDEGTPTPTAVKPK